MDSDGACSAAHGSGSPRNGSSAIFALPLPRLVKTAALAEVYAAEVLQALGFKDARPTPTGADEGIDVVAAEVVGQVKMEGVLTGRPAIQALFGVASAEAKKPVFFLSPAIRSKPSRGQTGSECPASSSHSTGSIDPRNRSAEVLLGGAP